MVLARKNYEKQSPTASLANITILDSNLISDWTELISTFQMNGVLLEIVWMRWRGNQEII